MVQTGRAVSAAGGPAPLGFTRAQPVKKIAAAGVVIAEIAVTRVPQHFAAPLLAPAPRRLARSRAYERGTTIHGVTIQTKAETAAINSRIHRTCSPARCAPPST